MGGVGKESDDWGECFLEDLCSLITCAAKVSVCAFDVEVGCVAFDVWFGVAAEGASFHFFLVKDPNVGYGDGGGVVFGIASVASDRPGV